MEKRDRVTVTIVFLTFVFLFLFIWFVSWSFRLNQGPPKVVSAMSAACQELVLKNCNVSTNSIIVRNFDANKDGKIDAGDTLFELCKNYYVLETDSKCKTKLCGCQ